jgi:hypothetical protein
MSCGTGTGRLRRPHRQSALRQIGLMELQPICLLVVRRHVGCNRNQLLAREVGQRADDTHVRRLHRSTIASIEQRNRGCDLSAGHLQSRNQRLDPASVCSRARAWMLVARSMAVFDLPLGLPDVPFARQAQRTFAWPENHGLENAGSVCHGEAEITGGVP